MHKSPFANARLTHHKQRATEFSCPQWFYKIHEIAQLFFTPDEITLIMQFCFCLKTVQQIHALLRRESLELLRSNVGDIKALRNPSGDPIIDPNLTGRRGHHETGSKI